MAKKKVATVANGVRKYIVKAPVKDYCGIGAAGVQFAYGKAIVCEGWVLGWFKEHGYEVEELKEESTENVVEPNKEK